MAAEKRQYWTEEDWDDMEKTLLHYDEEEALQAARPSRKRTKTDVYGAPVENDLVETKRRSILAATEYLVGFESKTGLGVTELCTRHGLSQRSSVYREIKIIRNGPNLMAAIFSLARTEPKIISKAADWEETGSDSSGESDTESAGMTDQQRYSKAMAEATLAVSKSKKKAGTVEGECCKAEAKWPGVHLNRETVRKRSRTHPRLEPNPRGRPNKIDPVEEEKLVCLVEAMRAMKIAVYRSTLFFLANESIKGTEYEKRFKDGKVTRKWFRRFSKDWKHRLQLKNAQKLEMARDKWTTSENINTHYKVMEELLLELGFAEVNPDYDATIPFDPDRPDAKECQPIFIKNEALSRIFSFNETEAATDMSGGSKSFGRGWNEKVFAAKKTKDKGETLTNKTSHKATMVGGSCMAGLSLRAQTIFNTKPEAGWIYKKGPESTFVKGGRRCTPIFSSSANGGTNNECLLDFLRRNFVEVNEEKPWEGAVVHASKENPIVVICDGHGTHLDLEVLDFCRDNGIHLVLRPPHTSHATQVEDVANFGVFKTDLRINNENLLTAKALAAVRDKYKLPYVKLDNADLMDCARVPWERAFDRSRCLGGWAKVGLSPFNRRLFWELKEKELLAKETVDECEVKVGLDFSSFTLKQVSAATRGPRHVGGERVADVEDENEDGEGDADGEDNAEHRAVLQTRMTSANQWYKGAVTGDEAYNSIKDWRSEKSKEKEERAASRAAQAEKDEATQLLAAGSCEAVRAIVHEKGWVYGRPGTLTKALLEQVFVWLGKPKQSGNNTPAQIELVKQLLGWTAERGFDPAPLAASAPPAPPPPP